MAKQIKETHQDNYQTHNNEFLSMNGKDRLRSAIEFAKKSAEEDLNDKEKKDYLDCIISIQHLLADKFKINKDLNPQIVETYGKVISDAMLRFSKIGIKFPENQYTSDIPFTKVSEFYNELVSKKKLIDISVHTNNSLPKNEQDYILAIVIRFQNLLTNLNSSGNILSTNQELIVENSLKVVGSILTELSKINAKLPIENYKKPVLPEQNISEENDKSGIEESFWLLIDQAVEKSAEWKKSAQKYFNKGLEKYKKNQENKRRKKAESRRNEVLSILSTAKAGDEIHLTNIKTRKKEIHVIQQVNPNNQFSFKVTILDKNGRKIDEDFKPYTYYTSLKTAKNIEVRKTKEIDKSVSEIIGQNNKLSLTESIKTYLSPYGLKIAAGSDKGVARKGNNEDRVLVMPNLELFSVIDGMGGHGQGDIAAQIIAESLEKSPENLSIALQEASNRIKREANNAKATFIAARIHKAIYGEGLELTYAYSGDCSLMVIKKNGEIIEGKTTSYTDKLIGQRKITKDESYYHKDRNNPGRGISSSDTKYYQETINIEKGDRVILMSDGISDNFTPIEISQIVRGKNPENAIKALDKKTSKRMENWYQTILDTELPYNTNFKYNDHNDLANQTDIGRRTNGKYADGYKTMPKPDNRGIVIIDV